MFVYLKKQYGNKDQQFRQKLLTDKITSFKYNKISFGFA